MISKSGIACAAAIILTGCGGDDPHASRRVENPTSTLKDIPTPQLRSVLKGYDGDWLEDNDMGRGVAEPPRQKPLPADAVRIALTPPEEFKVGDLPLREALASRRSRREFSADPLTLEELSFLLWATQGITARDRDAGGEVTQEFRTAPSAGGRFPLETFLSVHRVAGVPPGIYRYLPSNHQLVLVREDPDMPTKITATCYGQEFAGDSAVVFLWAAVPYRTEWKYAYLSHRMIAMEAGHVCQNLYLAAESIGAGTCALLSYHQQGADSLVGADGEEEFVVYIACLGKIP